MSGEDFSRKNISRGPWQFLTTLSPSSFLLSPLPPWPSFLAHLLSIPFFTALLSTNLSSHLQSTLLLSIAPPPPLISSCLYLINFLLPACGFLLPCFPSLFLPIPSSFLSLPPFLLCSITVFDNPLLRLIIISTCTLFTFLNSSCPWFSCLISFLFPKAGEHDIWMQLDWCCGGVAGVEPAGCSLLLCKGAQLGVVLHQECSAAGRSSSKAPQHHALCFVSMLGWWQNFSNPWNCYTVKLVIMNQFIKIGEKLHFLGMYVR